MTQTAAQQKQRRIAPRRKPRPSTRITCRKGNLGLGPNYAATLLDVSESGMRLVVNTEFKAQQEVQVSLLGPACMREVVRNGIVVWSLPTADGAYCVGIAFEKRLDYTALQDFTKLL